jgi:hypothetical protein
LASVRIASNEQELTYQVVEKHALDFRGKWVVNKDDEDSGHMSLLVTSPNALYVKADQFMNIFDTNASWDNLVIVEEADVEPLPAPKKPKKVKQSRAAKAKRSYRPPAPRSSTLGLDSSKDDAMDVDITSTEPTQPGEGTAADAAEGNNTPAAQQESAAQQEPSEGEAQQVNSATTSTGQDDKMDVAVDSASVPNGVAPPDVPSAPVVTCEFDGPEPSPCKVHKTWEDCRGNMVAMLQHPDSFRCFASLIRAGFSTQDPVRLRDLLHSVVDETIVVFDQLIQSTTARS